MGIALILGATLGIIFCDSYSAWGNVINGIGDIFLHAINMIVIPLVFLSTVLGISTMTDSKSMGRIAVKTFLYFIVTAVLAAAVGVIVADVLRPGYGTHKAEVDASCYFTVYCAFCVVYTLYYEFHVCSPRIISV